MGTIANTTIAIAPKASTTFVVHVSIPSANLVSDIADIVNNIQQIITSGITLHLKGTFKFSVGTYNLDQDFNVNPASISGINAISGMKKEQQQYIKETVGNYMGVNIEWGGSGSNMAGTSRFYATLPNGNEVSSPVKRYLKKRIKKYFIEGK